VYQTDTYCFVLILLFKLIKIIIKRKKITLPLCLSNV
jgi:hypothetical protein